MCLFHSHSWREESRHWTPPAGLTSIKSGTPDAVERLVWGLTIICLRCVTCGDLKSVELKGHQIRDDWDADAFKAGESRTK